MAINIFEPLKFSTQGIRDLATEETLVVSNGKITVDNVEPKQHLAFSASNFADLDGKGIKWTDGRKSKGVSYKSGDLYADISFNLAEDQSYKIDESTVLSLNELGTTVTKSNLKQVGVLRSLKVAGSAEFGSFTFINSELNRIGINTETPEASLGIVENGVELVLGSYHMSSAIVGTKNSRNLDIITDNAARIRVSSNGDVQVFGKLIVEEIQTARSAPLTFKETDTSSNYGKGIIWASKQGTNNSQFVLQANPDRIWSTEIIDLEEGKYFAIGGSVVLGKYNLGSSVTESSLTKLGVLSELQVAGDAAVTRTLSAGRIEVGNTAYGEGRILSRDSFEVLRNTVQDFQLAENITLGNAQNANRLVSVHGRVTVGTASAREDTSLTVSGPISFENKRFSTGSSAPSDGNHRKGDIVWNDNPSVTGYIGWICVTSGTPGTWYPFGAIVQQ